LDSTCFNLTLSNQAVEVLVVWSLNAKIATADVIDGLVVDHEAAIRVFESGMSGQDGVVWLDNGRCHLRSWVDAELKLALLAIVNRQTLHQQRAKTGTCATTEGVEDKETLQTSAIISNTANLIQDLVDELLPNGVMATSVVVGRILFPGDHLFGVEQTSIRAGAHFVDDIGFEIAVNGTRDIFAISCGGCCEQIILPVSGGQCLPVSEKKVLKPWSGSAALRSSVRYPSG
jgi:hypothetical protein